MKIGLLHPGEMGASIGAVLTKTGHEVLYLASGRSSATRNRAVQAGLYDAGLLPDLVGQVEVLFSICPPSAALEVATSVMQVGFAGMYVDANAIAPQSAVQVAAVVQAGQATYVDGGIIGPPVREAGQTRLYLSGAKAPLVAGLFENTILETPILGEALQAASALKMAYAAWSKGSAALLLASRALARAAGVEAALVQEWQDSSPELLTRIERAANSSAKKGWRWVGEMEEIALSMEQHNLPDGFHLGAAEVFRRLEGFKDADSSLDGVLEALVLGDERDDSRF
jgi:3-hydroxyisobutyrate dehydrogenase-like beta-hydroxyacid dehydrogenase